ncbi:DUF905 family protein [Shigella flexneri]
MSNAGGLLYWRILKFEPDAGKQLNSYIGQ